MSHYTEEEKDSVHELPKSITLKPPAVYSSMQDSPNSDSSSNETHKISSFSALDEA